MNITSTSVSGLLANEKRVAVAASNISNAGSTNYQALDVVQQATGGGVSSDIVVREPATITVADDAGGTQVLPNVSLEEELINTQVATYNFQANVQVLKTQRELEKTLLDVLA